MGAAVRIEASAFSDERYLTLARLAGLADEDHARGKMARIWRHCTDHSVHIMSPDHIESILGPNGVDALLRSELGELVEGGIRVRGTSGRIEWLENLRKNGKKGGKAKARREPSKLLAKQEEEKEKEPVGDPSALSASDLLRDELVQQQPACKVAKLNWPLSRERRSWAKDFATMHVQDERPWDAIESTIRWLFHGQAGEARFVAECPRTLRAKWDRIAQMRARPAPQQRFQNSNPTGVALAELHRLEREAAARGEA